MATKRTTPPTTGARGPAQRVDPVEVADFVPRQRPLRSRERIVEEQARRHRDAERERVFIGEVEADDPEARTFRLRQLAECQFAADARDAEDLAALDRLDCPEGNA